MSKNWGVPLEGEDARVDNALNKSAEMAEVKQQPVINVEELNGWVNEISHFGGVKFHTRSFENDTYLFAKPIMQNSIKIEISMNS